MCSTDLVFYNEYLMHQVLFPFLSLRDLVKLAMTSKTLAFLVKNFNSGKSLNGEIIRMQKKFYIDKCLFISMKRGRKPGPDPEKINSILNSLVQHQEGLWIRQIARLTKLHPTTVTKYLEGVLNPLVDSQSLGDIENKKPLLKVFRLKPIVLQKLEEGNKIGDILKLLRAIHNV